MHKISFGSVCEIADHESVYSLLDFQNGGSKMVDLIWCMRVFLGWLNTNLKSEFLNYTNQDGEYNMADEILEN